MTTKNKSAAAGARKKAAPVLPQAPTTVRPSPKLSFGLALALVCAVGFVLTAYYAIKFGVPYADTLLYVEQGRSLMEGHGFVIRFNMVHGWSGRLDHPALAYYNPLYGLVLGTLWWLLGNAGYVGVLATALPCCLNAALVAVLVRPTMGSLTALLCAIGYLLLPTTWFNIGLLSVEHPTVTILLVSLLIIQRRVPRDARSWAWVGALVGIGFFVKVSIALAVPGFVAAIVLAEGGPLPQRLRTGARPVALFAAGLAVVIVPYTLLCRVAVGEFYPSYPRTGQNWALSITYGGHYVPDSPAVHPDLTRMPSPVVMTANVIINVWIMVKWIAGEIGPLIFLAIVGLVRANDAARRQAVFLLSIGASYALGFAAAVTWDKMDPAMTARYSIYTATFWYPVAVYGLVRLADWGVGASALRVGVVVAIWALASIPVVRPLYASLLNLAQAKEPRVAHLQQVMHAAAELVSPDELVAVAGGGLLICGAVFLDRPVVALPQLAMDTPQAMKEFIDVYHPKLVIPGSNRSAYQVLPLMGYQSRRLSKGGGQTVFLRQG